MGRNAKPTESKRSERKPRDKGKTFKKKPCLFCKEGTTWIDYKDVNVLRRYMSDRAKIKARAVSGNCAQHQRDVAVAIKNARELALLPFATRVTSSRGGGRDRGGRGDRGDRGERGPREDRPRSDRPDDGTLLVDGQPVAPDTVLVGADAEGLT
jgi:small subunit ribosomal protein S18